MAFPGHIAQHTSRAARWIEQSGQHFERRRLAGAIRTEKSYQLAWLNGEADILDRHRLLIFPPKQASDRPAKPRLLFVSAKCFAKVADFDCGHEQVLR